MSGNHQKASDSPFIQNVRAVAEEPARATAIQSLVTMLKKSILQKYQPYYHQAKNSGPSSDLYHNFYRHWEKHNSYF